MTFITLQPCRARYIVQLTFDASGAIMTNLRNLASVAVLVIGLSAFGITLVNEPVFVGHEL